ncbi:ABC transporter permease [Mesorhizobium sophorae]|uniref:HoxN/HupN/NixA family nickel/cobalt transporter n=1 Tax=Mesorhizobium sophorae TaxID=1300294 RepID=UPI000BA31BB8|nr:ABC transporter permease [Mesorhizobium sophorae]
MFQHLVAIQREIYLAFADRIGGFAKTGDWAVLAAYLPMGIVFGAVHAMTPGHSKAVLATYLTGSTASLPRALLVTLVLSFTHVTTSVIIALLSLPLVSVALGSVGRAPLLEDISRGLLGVIGLWMLWQAFRREHDDHGSRQGSMVGFMAGLIPCPLTLFVMTFAISRGVPQAGVAFAVTMMLGVACTLSVVDLAAVVFRQQLLRLLETRPRVVDAVTRAIQILAGLVLVIVAWNAIIAK